MLFGCYTIQSPALNRILKRNPLLAEEIPVIDFGPLVGGEYHNVAMDFASAYSQVGFGAIVNHGVDPLLVQRLFDASRAFHAQSLSQKMSVALDHNHRGYIPINTSTDVNSVLAEVKKPNQSESFMVMREDAPDSKPVVQGAYLAGANQWPVLPDFKDSVVAYNNALSQLARQVLCVACIAMGVDERVLLRAFEYPTTWLRLLHYPPMSMQSPQDLYGSAPHTDFGAVTILAQHEVGGLQVMGTDNNWLDVPVIDGAFVVNIGDMLHRWSNGYFKSTPHRVINRSGLERYSCAFFYDPYVETIVAPLTDSFRGGETAKFEPLHYGEFLRSELEAAYQQHKTDSDH